MRMRSGVLLPLLLKCGMARHTHRARQPTHGPPLSTSKTYSVLGPWTPSTRESSMSLVAEGPERRASIDWALCFPSPMKPGGSRSLHALMAFFHAAVLGSSDEPALIPVGERARRVRVRELADTVVAH